MRPLSAITAPIIARLAERTEQSLDAANAEVCRLADENRRHIERLEAGQRRPQPQGKETA